MSNEEKKKSASWHGNACPQCPSVESGKVDVPKTRVALDPCEYRRNEESIDGEVEELEKRKPVSGVVGGRRK
jgi:hypothetical protein